ncbi:ATP phosphoribosyltransferase regulatory subunit, partial [Bacillus cereus]|nr:ATP phosphoribosyltransferase regulatory subunit [Bacillus cereus]
VDGIQMETKLPVLIRYDEQGRQEALSAAAQLRAIGLTVVTGLTGGTEDRRREQHGLYAEVNSYTAEGRQPVQRRELP